MASRAEDTMNPIVRETLIGLARIFNYDGPVFSYSRNGVSDQTIRNGFRRACEAAKIPYGQAADGDVVWHDLRHTFATWLREEGVPELEIMQLMGHSSPNMTRSYAHSTHRILQEAVNKLAKNGNNVLAPINASRQPQSRHFHVIGGKTANWLKTEVTVTL